MKKVCLIVIGLLLSLCTIAYSAGLDGGVMGSQYATPVQPPPLGATEGGPLSGTVLAGVDVSVYQGTINWDALKAAKDFAIMRSSYGVGYTDGQLSRNRSEARRVGILRGYYHFAYPNYGNAAVDEADQMLSSIGTLQAGEILCLDYEVSYSDPVTWCLAFLNRIYSRTSVKPFLYINQSIMNAYNWSPVKNAGYPLWFAYWDYNSNPATPTTSWGFTAIKQYSNLGNVAGLNPVDLDSFNGDASAFIAYSASGSPDTTPPVISNVQATGINSSGATITWTTDDPSTSRVDYGLTNSYGSSTTEDTNLVTSHSVPLTGLSASTPYHYRVKSTNGSSLTTYSGDYTFTTSAIISGCPQNGDFESGFSGSSPTQIGTGWTKMSDDGTSTYTQDTGTKHAGTSSQKIQDLSGGEGYTGYVYQTISVVPSRQYVLRFYSYRASGGFVVGMAVDVNGGTTFSSAGENSGTGGSWVLKETPAPFTSGAGGVITIAYYGGYNGGESVGWIDDITIAPAKPSTTGGTTTICSGSSTSITASGGYGGSSSELHWYTGADGGGVSAGTGTTLSVSPTVTTTYYPRWEASSNCGGCCVSDDGAAVTVTVNPPPSAVTVTDEGSYTPSLNTLKASWTASSSNCGISRYDYAVGTSSTTQNIKGWTSNGTSTSVTISGLSLVESTTYYIQARAVDNYGNTSDAASANGILAAPGVTPISSAWARPNDSPPLSLRDKIVTAQIGGAFWLEEINRTSAIRVVSGASVAKGNTVSVAGVLKGDGTSRYLLGDVVIDSGGNTVIQPLGVACEWLGGGSYNTPTFGITGGVGQYNIGMLVRCWGNVTYYDTADAQNKYFYLDDGSGLASGGHDGVKVWCGSIAPPTGGTVIVSGVISSESIGGKIVPIVMIRDGGDVRTP